MNPFSLSHRLVVRAARIAALALFAGIADTQAQTCADFNLPDTVEHCTNDPLLLVPQVEPCLSAFSLELDGGNDRVEWNTAGGHLLSDPRGNMTWAGWWKMDPNPNNDLQFLWEEGNSTAGWNLYHENGILFAGWWAQGDTSAWVASVLPFNAFSDWTHVAVVADASESTWRVYVDLVLVGQTTGYAGLPQHDGNATLGAGGSTLLHTGQVINGGGGIPFEWTGWADEAALWSTALNDSTLAVASQCPLDVGENLEAAWLMEPGTEYEAMDFSGNGWTGNMAGSELVNESPDTWAGSYLWSTGATTPGLSVDMGNGNGDLPTGWVFLTITLNDSTVCQDSTYAVDWNPNVVATVTPPTCFGGSDGSLVATLDGGTAPYTVEINQGADLAALSAGQYQVTVTDANGCDDQSNVFVTQPQGMDFNVTTTPDDCNEVPVGTVTLNTLSSANGGAVVDWGGLALDSLAGGTYFVTASDSAGCVQEFEFFIDTDLATCGGCSQYGIDLLPDTLWDCFQGPAQVVAGNVTCPNFFALELDGSNDRIELGTPQGGGPGGGQPGNPLFGDEVVAMTLSIEFNPADLNNKQVLYKEGNQNAGLALYMDNDSLRAGWWDDASANPNGVWVAVGGLQADTWQRGGWGCDAANGTMWVALEGGEVAFASFADTLGAHNEGGYIGATQSIRFHDGPSFAGGGGGGWIHEFEGLIDRFAMWDLAMDIDTWQGVTFCPETTLEENLFAFHSFESDANDVSLDEGYGAINGEYGSGANNTPLNTSTQDNYLWSDGDTTPYNFLNGSGNGTTYTLFYSNQDFAGCLDSIVVFDWNPQAYVASVTPPSCQDATNGSVELALNGGQAPYTWTLFGGANPDSLGVGTYNAIVTDANGCSDFTQFALDAQVAWEASVSVDAILCPSDSTAGAFAEVSDENGPYTYSWDDGAFGTDSSALALPLGPHVLTVTDADGCVEALDVLVAFTEATLQVNVVATPPPCVGTGPGTAEAVVTGGVAPYTLDWAGEDPLNLAPGTYGMSVTDAAGCSLPTSFTVDESAALELVASVVDVACNGGTEGQIILDVPNATGNVAIDWGTAGPDGTGLSAGTYTVTVTDEGGCSADTTLVISQPDPVASGSLTGPSVIELGVGTLYTYTAAGGPGTTVVWSVSGGMLATSDFTQAVVFWQDPANLSICVYEVDANGCASEEVCIEELFSTVGCMDVAACNYNPAATVDDASCLYPGEPCDDGLALTYGDVVQDGCVCLGFSCYDDLACNYSLEGVEDASLCSYLTSYEITGNASPFSQTLQGYTYPATDGSTYAWTVVGGDIVDGQGSNALYVVWNTGGPGSICVTETTVAGCVGDNVCLIVDVSLSGIEEALGGTLEVFPVPARDRLHIVWNGPTLDNASVTLRDATGRIVHHQRVGERDVLALEGFSAGSYMLEFVVPERGALQRRIVLH